jgi:MoaA/NifB/PqqE/SkfB family radical SAM enzyme
MRNFWMGAKKRDEILAREGVKPPFNFLISPTMRCNLRCVGCYAANYSPDDDLELEVIDRVINEGKELGIYFVTTLGGEPFIRDDMWNVYRKHNDVLFQVFTNATLIDEEAATRLGRLGNVFPVISIEGFEEETDARRGQGTFQKIVAAMDHLRKAGVLFGFSAMLTRNNVDAIISDEFNDMLIANGCLFGWHFLYIPVGRDPDSSLMPTPEQRERIRIQGAARIRKQKPLLICDFWNDAPYVGGCIAGGRYYFHINAHGDVEPCIFVHFALDNIKNKSLWEAVRSPFFEAIRARQPYHHNLLRPCMIIDHPTILREVCNECHPYPTHPGSESVVTSMCGALDQYASGVAEILDPPWQSEFADKGFEPWSNL